jgi:hypothetical protein
VFWFAPLITWPPEVRAGMSVVGDSIPGVVLTVDEVPP